MNCIIAINILYLLYIHIRFRFYRCNRDGRLIDVLKGQCQCLKMFRITRNDILAKSNLLHLLSRSLIFLLNLHKDIVNLIVDQKSYVASTNVKDRSWSEKTLESTKHKIRRFAAVYQIAICKRCWKRDDLKDVYHRSKYLFPRARRMNRAPKKTRKQRGILQWRIK